MVSSAGKWDVIVAGLGAVGSATLYQLTRRRVKVLGLDRFRPPHDRGSSHGETRITRLALGEGEHFGPFVRRSHEIWRELEAVTGRCLMRNVGGLIYGASSQRAPAHGASDFLQTTIGAAERQGIAHEILDAVELGKRFPQFHLQGDEVGYYEPEAGYVHPEACIAAQLELAHAGGAQIGTDEPVLHWQAGRHCVWVTTQNSRYAADRLILCAGPWLPDLVPPLAPRTKVFRQVLFWFEPNGPREPFLPERMPVFIRVPDAQTQMFYGFPIIPDANAKAGLKVAGEQFNHPMTADEEAMAVRAEEQSAMYQLASPHVGISPRCVRTAVCKYTVTPDFGFVIDRHPESERVWFASACSGHGFKHSAGVGEALAEMALAGRSHFDLTPFRLDRFQHARPPGG